MSTDIDAPAAASEGKKKRRGMVPTGERLAYIIGSGSHFTAHFFISAFLATYLLMIGIPPAISAVVVLVLRVWDAANDVLFGYLVDRVRLNGGKNPFLRWLFRGRYLPWYRIAAFILPIAMIVTFTVNTDAPIWLRIVQYAIGYMLYDFAYTLSSTPYGSMLNTLTNDNNERTTLQSYSALGQIVSNLPVLILGTLLIAGSWGYAGSAILFAFWGLLLAIPAMFAVKERNVAITEPEPEKADAEAEHDGGGEPELPGGRRPPASEGCERGARVRSQEVEGVVLVREASKAESLVERHHIVVERVHQDCTNSDCVGGLESSGGGVLQERVSKSLPLELLVNGQAPEEHHGNARRHSRRQLRRPIVADQRAGRQAVVPRDTSVAGDGDQGAGCARLLVASGSPPQPIVERLLPTAELGELIAYRYGSRGEELSQRRQACGSSDRGDPRPSLRADP